MRLVVVVLAVVLLGGVSTLGQAGGNTPGRVPKDEQELRTLFKKWDEAVVKGDAGTLDALLADEFSFVGGWGKGPYLRAVAEGEFRGYKSRDITELQVQVYGGAAVVSALLSYKMLARAPDDFVTGRDYIMSVWVRRDGRWQGVKACLAPKEEPMTKGIIPKPRR